MKVIRLMPAAIVVENVSKKFLIGSARYSSLRDALVGGWRRLCGRPPRSETERTREFWALRGVTFEVEKGATLGIIGPNGAGKSTLLKLISRVSRPTAGQIITQGRVSALIEVGAGFHPELTGRENIYLNGSILGMTRREIGRKFDAIVDFAGLEQFIDTPVKHYSSGMYARLGFSVAAHVEPDILLVDEVLSVGDWGFQQKCLERMQQIVEGGATVVFVSHNLQAVSRLCPKCMLLDQGRIIALTETAEAISRYQHVAGALTREGARANGDGQAATEVEVLSLDLLDAGRRPVRSLESEQDFHVVVRTRFRRPCEDPVMVLAIRDSRGMLAFRTDTRIAGCEIGPVPAGETVRVSLAGRMNLLGGDYRLIVGLEASKHERALALDRDRLAFSVLDNHRASGCTSLSFRLKTDHE